MPSLKKSYLGRVIPVLVLCAVASLPAAAQKLNTTQSEIAFVTKQMGVPVEGRFKKFDAQIAFDPKRPETSTVSFTIDTASAAFGAPETDAEAPRAIWFNVLKYPHATFRSAAVKRIGAGQFEVRGQLTVKGYARDVVIPLLVKQAGGESIATGAFNVKRLDFKIGEGEWTDTSLLADDVQVKFKLVLSGLAPL
jgi:polyisoprenoid-binding protein YceI